MNCSGGRMPTATTSSSAPARRPCWSKGFRPVGKDFPVFLHPETHEEYALARTERKTGHGYHGFAFHAAPDVTLEEDLARRDLTINAMARATDGTLIDPFHGQRDLAGQNPAPCRPGLRRRSGAHPAPRPLCRPLRRFFGGAGNAGTDARHGRRAAKSIIWLPSASGRNWQRV